MSKEDGMEGKFGLSAEAWAYVRDGGSKEDRARAMDEVSRQRTRGTRVYMEGGTHTDTGADEQEQGSETETRQ